MIHSDEGNQWLCNGALSSLASVLVASSSFLKPVMHKVIYRLVIIIYIYFNVFLSQMQLLQEHFVKLCLNVVSRNMPKSHLYALPESRSTLYDILYILVAAAHSLCPPPLQYATEVLSVAMIRDANPNVRQVCANHVRSLEKILHPQKETLLFAAEIGEVRDALKDLHQLNGRSVRVEDEESADEDMVFQNYSLLVCYLLISFQFKVLVLPDGENASDLGNDDDAITTIVSGKTVNARSISVASNSDEDTPVDILKSNSVTFNSNNDDASVNIRKSIDLASSSDEEADDILAAPSSLPGNTSDTSVGNDATTTNNDPRIVWTEDLDDEDTLAISDDDIPANRASNDVVEIIDDVGSVRGLTVGDKRSNGNDTIDISDDEEELAADSTRRSKRSKTDAENGDQDAIADGVMDTFFEELM